MNSVKIDRLHNQPDGASRGSFLLPRWSAMNWR